MKKISVKPKGEKGAILYIRGIQKKHLKKFKDLAKTKNLKPSELFEAIMDLIE